MSTFDVFDEGFRSILETASPQTLNLARSTFRAMLDQTRAAQRDHGDMNDTQVALAVAWMMACGFFEDERLAGIPPIALTTLAIGIAWESMK